jgi:hypothetical protein
MKIRILNTILFCCIGLFSNAQFSSYNWNGAMFYSANTQAKRYIIGRVYFNAYHWGSYGNMKIKIKASYFSSGNLEYLIQNQQSGIVINCISAFGTLANYGSISLGEAVNTGTNYSGGDNFYKEIYLDVDYYTSWTAECEVTGLFEMNKFSLGSETQYSYMTLFSSPLSQSIASFYTNSKLIKSSSGNHTSIFDGNIGIGTNSPSSKLNVFQGAGDNNVGSAAIRVGGTDNYPSLEFGIKGPYDGMISTYGNDLHIYAGNWRSNGATASENHNISFYTSQAGSPNWNTAKMVLNHYGNLGIGTINPSERLSVNGNIRAKKLIVSQQNWSDYVFYKGYKLRPLNELEKYIQKYQHLPDVPSTKEVQSKGINVGDTQALLLKKIEELTLYIIELEKKINQFVKLKS